ncbi:MAG: hypothetical protein IT242_06010, partial [Bacteroidia bacterium]|nr:hypothetical protein [Bacteroidia bacterium]
MNIRVKEVTTARELKDFVNFPYTLYSGNRYFVPPLRFDEAATLNRKKNPAFEYCDARYWLAYKNDKIAGRVAAIMNHAFVKKWNRRYMRFGWFDFIEDETVASALLEQVEKYAHSMECEAIHGPMGFTDLDHEGMLVEGFEETGTLATIYNYPYYPKVMEKLGYRKDTDWVEFRIKMPDGIPENIERLAAIVQARYKLNVVRAKKAKEVLKYTKSLFDIINKSYAHLYGVVELTDKQIAYYTKQYFSFIRTDYLALVTDATGQLIAFGITMPSLSAALQKNKGRLLPFGFLPLLRAMKKNDVADLYLVAVRPDWQGKGVNALLMRELNASYVR